MIGRVPEKAVLKRVITLPWLVLYGLGSTVGAGIYVLTGVVAGSAGMLAPLAFIVAAVLALFTALSFAELSARFPRAGGALVYVREGIGSAWLSWTVGLLTATAGMVSAATVSLGFVGYFSEISALPPMAVLCVVVGGVGAVAGWGILESVIAASLITLIEVSGLIAILAFGMVHLESQAFDVAALAQLGVGVDKVGWWVMGQSTVLCFFAFLGFEDIVNVAEEVRDVRRTLPKAILWTLGLSTALYVAVTAVSVLVVAPAELADAAAPLALVFERSGGSAEILALIALAAMLNGALVQMVMASRILYSLSREGPLPRCLGRIDPRTQTPLAATILIALGVGLLAAIFPLAGLASATARIALIVFSLVNVSLALLLGKERRRGEAAVRSLPIWIPVVGAITSISFVAIDLIQELA